MTHRALSTMCALLFLLPLSLLAQEPVAAPEEVPAPAGLPTFEWGDTELDASRMELIRQYQRERLWTQDTLPTYKRGLGPKVRYSYAVRGGKLDFWGTADLLEELGDTKRLYAYKLKEQRQTTAAALLIGAGSVAAGVGIVLWASTGPELNDLNADILALAGDATQDARDERAELVARRAQLQGLTPVGAVLAGAGSALAAVTGLVIWQQRIKATNVWANLRRAEADALLDTHNRALAEELGLTEEEARLLQIHYGVRRPPTPPTVQVAVGPGGVSLFGTF